MRKNEHMIRRLAAAALGALAMTTAALIATASSASAATCSGYGCDGQNPYGAGCFTGSEIIDDKPLTNSAGQTDGRVRLHYSPTCRTVWASIYDAPADSGEAGDADIHRNSDNHRFDCTVPAGSSSCYTAMLYDGGVTSHAHAEWSPGTLPGVFSATTVNY